MAMANLFNKLINKVSRNVFFFTDLKKVAFDPNYPFYNQGFIPQQQFINPNYIPYQLYAPGFQQQYQGI
jgi:hypothetical protein